MLVNRGPDLTNSHHLENYVFTHFLLHITGKVTPQPFVNDDIVILYNGEIYSASQEYESDGLCLMPLYQQYGEDFMTHLDGEYAICVYDFKKGIAILATDIFGTKPLWYSTQDGHLQVSSHQSALIDINIKDVQRLRHNSRLIFDLQTGKVRDLTQDLFKFDLRQYKNTYDDWIATFFRAIRKRIKNVIHPVFVCLSSGYDSGAICCVLDKIRIRYRTYTIRATENQKILDKRLARYVNNGDPKNMSGAENEDRVVLSITPEDFQRTRQHVLERCEHYSDEIIMHCDHLITQKAIKPGKSMIIYNRYPYKTGDQINITHVSGRSFPIPEGRYYVIKHNDHRFRLSLRKDKLEHKDAIPFRETSTNFLISIDSKGNQGNIRYSKKYDPLNDWAAVGLAKIFSEARKSGRLIYLSGQGGDEIYSDYGHNGKKYKSCSLFGGKFPDDLSEIFPWKTFFESTQRAFIDKEESIAGGYGIESRYPFLDRDVVQEFLWLSPILKNQFYKAPLHELMERYNYPFQPNEKIGFKAHRDK